MLQIGSLVEGKYKILSKIGEGGMSVVYMAINEKVNKTWAIKEVRKNGTMDLNAVTQGLTAEIDTLKKLSHPNMPSIIDVIDEDDNYIIIMDYIEGQSLNKILESEGAQSEEDVVKWAIQICDVLSYLHSQNPAIIYRDMKPHNIMLKPDGNIKIIDFGTAKTYDVDYGQTTGLGTAGYAAPEQYIDRKMGRTDARTDIYGLGITMYHLLTNVDPTKNIIKVKSIREVNPTLSHGLDLIVQKCTQELPSERYQSCAELMYDLENYGILEPLHKKKQKRKFNLFLSSVVLTILMLVAGVGFNIAATSKETGTYDNKLYEASKTTKLDEKIALYEECIGISNMEGRTEAYKGMLEAYKEDGVFSKEEVGVLEKYIKRNQESLKENQKEYIDLCFEMGKNVWYYYNLESGNNQVTRTMEATKWFKDVVESHNTEYQNYSMANAYYNIGDFHKKITTAIVEANDKGKYRPMFDSILQLINDVAVKQKESEMVRLELIKLATNSLHKYVTKYKLDGVSKDEVMELYNQIKTTINEIDTYSDITEKEKKKIKNQLPEVLSVIKVAYTTKNGGQ